MVSAIFSIPFGQPLSLGFQISFTDYNVVTRWINFRKKQLHEHELQLSDYDI